MSNRARKILCADDELAVRELIGNYLTESGFDVSCVTDGEEALDLACSNKPDVVLLDISMPKLDGISVCRELKSRQTTEDISVMLITGDSDPERALTGLEAGADDFVTKPVRLAELRLKIQNLVRRKQHFEDLKARNDELIEMIGGQSKLLADIFASTMQMNQAVRLNELLDIVASSFTRLLECQQASILLTQGNSRVRLAKYVGVHRIIEEDPTFFLGPEIEAEIVKGRRPYVVQRCLASAPWKNYLRRVPNTGRTVVVAPLWAGEALVGIVNLSEFKQEFDESTVLAVIRCLSDTAGQAIVGRLREIEIRETQDVTIFALAKLAENRDELGENHLLRVQLYTRELAELLYKEGHYPKQLVPEFIEEICRAVPLHDIGKVGIPDRIVNNPDRLTEEEFKILSQHSEIGGRTLQAAALRLQHSSFLRTAQEICFSHHERWDGTGYPWNLKGEEIPLSARIFACADVYDALTTPRAYRPALDHSSAVNTIRDGRGTQFDPLVCDAFLQIHERFREMHVLLSDGEQIPTPELPSSSELSE